MGLSSRMRCAKGSSLGGQYRSSHDDGAAAVPPAAPAEAPVASGASCSHLAGFSLPAMPSSFPWEELPQLLPP
jgi:hypothetical protein